MQPRVSVVTDLFFGDCGKGSATAFLTSPNEMTLNVRFSGGNQAGHTVVTPEGSRHVFSQIGSGTFNGATTYISENCTFDPLAFLIEIDQISKLSEGYPTVCINPRAMVVTPFDVGYNRTDANNLVHGTCGVGFGATMKRNEESPYKLFAVDLFHPAILAKKLEGIGTYYGYPLDMSKVVIDLYMEGIKELYNFIYLADLRNIAMAFRHIIFEGSQGLMLDREYGFFPNVTRSKIRSIEAIKLIRDVIPKPDIDVYYVMRSYLTRHGAGHLPNEDSSLSFEDKTNTDDGFQGPLRFATHSESLIRYAIEIDLCSHVRSRSLIISHLDQTDGKILLEGDKVEIPKFHSKFFYGFGLYVRESEVFSDTIMFSHQAKLQSA